MKAYALSLWLWVRCHRSVSAGIFIALVIGGVVLVRAFTSDTTVTRYLLTTAERGTITATVSGTGQISASRQISVTAKASGAVTSIPVAAGLDPIDALRYE